MLELTGSSLRVSRAAIRSLSSLSAFRRISIPVWGALVLFCAAPVLRAQCSTSNGTAVPSGDISSGGALSLADGIATTNGDTNIEQANSSVTVSGITGTVGCVQVVLNDLSVANTSDDSQSLFYTEVILQSPDGRNMVVMAAPGSGSDFPSDLTMTIGDDYGAMPGASNCGTTALPSNTSVTYAPASCIYPGDDDNGYLSVSPEDPGSPTPTLTIADYPKNDGSATMSSLFTGAQANGTWKLYLVDFVGTPVQISSWSLNLWYTEAAGTAITLSSNANPATPTGAVTYTATVTSGGSALSGGTMEFEAATDTTYNTYTPISNCTAQTVDSSGVATCAVTLSAASSSACTATTGDSSAQSLPAFPSVCQGNQSIEAIYTPGSSSYAGSTSPALTQVVIPTPTQSGNEWCSTGPILVPYPGSYSGAAYPAVIPVSGYANGATVSTVSVTLNGLTSSPEGGAFVLVAPDGGTHNLDFYDSPFTTTGCSDTTFTIEDTAGNYPFEVADCPSGSASYSPFDEESAPETFVSGPSPSASSAVSAIPAFPSTVNYGYSGSTGVDAGGSSSNTFAAEFSGVPANGDWALYVSRGGNGTVPLNLSGGWCITLSANTGAATTTAVSSTQNPAPTGTPVTYTATVTSGGSPVTSGGTVTFLDGTAVPGGTTSGDNVVTLGATGTATFSSSSLYDQVDTSTTSSGIPAETTLYEGDHTINASYGGDSTDNASTGSMVERLNNPTTTTSTGSNSYQSCNAGPIYGGWGSIGPFTPNPSVIVPANIPGTISAVSLTLNNFYYVNDSGGESYPISYLESLLVGPTGAALDFFSDASSSESLTEGAYTFSDSGASAPSSGTISPGTYLPTSNSGSDSFVASASGFYPIPTLTTADYAQPKGSGTFDGNFGSTNPNGNWSLYFNETGYLFGVGAVNGWCVNFTENPVTVTADLSHSGTGTGGDFVQGESGAQITATIQNSGTTGPTGDPTGSNPLTVTDTLNAGLTYSSYSGTSWSCTYASPTVTCKNDSAVAQGSSYPTLTLNVNVASSAAASISNSVNVSGAGITPTSANDTIPVDATPVLAVVLTDNGGFKQGGTGQWIITVSNTAANGATSGQITVTDALPSGYTLSTATSSGDLWSCSGTSTVTCIAAPGIAGGGSSVITLTVNIPITSALSVNDEASAYGGGDTTHTSLATAAVSNTDTVSVAAAQLATTLTVSANPASIPYGQSVMLTATLAPYVNEGNSSNGENVTFYNGNGTINLGTGTLDNGIATLTTPALPAGTDSITATYGGDTYLLGSSATATTVTVSAPNFVVTTAVDDAGAATNCTPQASTTTGTDASCSLRDALLAAAADGAGNIYFDTASVFLAANSTAQNTIPLTNGTLTIPSTTVIYGATTGSGATLANLVTVSGGGSTSNFSVFTVNSGVTGAAIANLTITNGYSSSNGGGIYNSGTLTVTNSTVSGNQANNTTTAAGGGILNNGTLTVTNSTVSGNQANGPGLGGGGIYSSGTLTVTNSTVSGNQQSGVGAGGGGIDNYGTATVTNSTFSGNQANAGGGILNNNGTLTMTNSIFSGNSASGSNVGGLYNAGTIANESNNVYYNNTGGNTSGFTPSGTDSTGNPNLAPLGNYGGPTQTLIPLPGSSAICAGLAADIASGVTTDQRGEPDKNTSYPGYNSTTPCVDAGAVQTSYALSFSTEPPSSVAADADFSSAVTLSESGAPFVFPASVTNPPALEAIALSLTNHPSGVTLSGGSAAPAATTGIASYPDLTVSAPDSNDSLTATLSLNSALTTPLSITAESSALSAVPAAPTVTAVSPASGAATGGTAVTITGTYLTGATAVSFGGAAATSFTVNSATSITATAPASAGPATVDVTVTTPYGTNTTSAADQFTYTAVTPTLSFAPIASQSYGNASFAVSATSASSGGVTYSIVSGPGTISGDKVTITGAGSIVIEASQTASGDYAAATAQTTVSVAKAALAVTANPATMPYGGPLPALSGTLSGVVGNDGITASYSTNATVTSAAGGTYSVTATLNDPNNRLSNYTVTNTPAAFTITQAAQTITFTLASTMTYSPGATVALGGSASSGLAVSYAASPASVCAVSGSTLSIAGAGTCAVTASQSGNTDYTAAQSVAQSITIGKATPSVRWPAPAAIVYGTALGSAELDATASAPGSFTYTPAAGTVLAVGAHTLSAAFTPTDTADYNTPGAVTTSLSVTAATLDAAANNATKAYGTANPSFTGSVSGAVNGDSFTSSYATAATQSSPVGTYAIVPSVTGADLSDYTVRTTDGTLSVTQAASSVAVAASATSLTPGQSLTLTATAADATPDSIGTPTGTVSFFDGTTQIGTATLSNGVARMSISTLAAGVSHSLTATYAGDTNFAGSSASAPVSVTVGTLDFTVTAPPTTTLTATSGGTTTTSFSITPTYGSYQGTVNFSITGLPFGATATFSPASIPADTSTQQTVTLTIHLAQPQGASQQASMTGRTSRLWRSGAPFALGLLVLPFATMRRLRKSLPGRATLLLMVAAAGLAGTASLSGCAAVSGFNATPAQSYTITVTAQAGPVTHSFQFNLNVR